MTIKLPGARIVAPAQPADVADPFDDNDIVPVIIPVLVGQDRLADADRIPIG
jgi:hypothetical protein